MALVLGLNKYTQMTDPQIIKIEHDGEATLLKIKVEGNKIILIVDGSKNFRITRFYENELKEAARVGQ